MRILLYVVFLAACGVANAQISLKEFISRKVFVINVEQKLDMVIANGYEGNAKNITEHKIKLERGQVFAIWNRPGKAMLSLITVPFKVRPSQENVPQVVSTGLSNAGIAVNFYNKRLDRYFASGKKTSHTFGIGGFLAPSAEDLKSTNTNGKVTTDVKQLFISTGLAFTYSYNDFTFVMVPAGWDVATTSQGKDWIYNKKLWWGFGLGINTRLFGFY